MFDFQYCDCIFVYDDYFGFIECVLVLLLYGFGLSVCDWEYQLLVLLGCYCLLVLDLCGYGCFGKLCGGYSMVGFVEDCVVLFDWFGCGLVYLVGISMGGMIGFQLVCD